MGEDDGRAGDVADLAVAGGDVVKGAPAAGEQGEPSGGLPVTADVYPYTAGSSGLTRIIPDRYHEGGPAALYDRLGVPEVRAAIRAELSAFARWAEMTEAVNVWPLDTTAGQFMEGLRYLLEGFRQAALTEFLSWARRLQADSEAPNRADVFDR